MYLSSWASNMGPPGCEVFSKGSLITWKKEYTAASGVQMDGWKGKTKRIKQIQIARVEVLRYSHFAEIPIPDI